MEVKWRFSGSGKAVASLKTATTLETKAACGVADSAGAMTNASYSTRGRRERRSGGTGRLGGSATITKERWQRWFAGRGSGVSAGSF